MKDVYSHNRISLLIGIIIFSFINISFGQEQPIGVHQPKVIIVYDAPVSSLHMAIAEESRQALIRSFNRFGRFMPEEQNNVIEAAKIIEPENLTPAQHMQKIAVSLKVDLIVSLSFSQTAKTHIADIKIRAVHHDYKRHEKSRRIQTKIPSNIPLLLSKEIAQFHKDIPIKATVIGITENGMAYISAGQWHGIEPDYYHTNKGRIKIIQTGKYYSIAEAKNLKKSDVLDIEVFPNISRTISNLDDKIEKNIVKTYATSEKLLKKQNDESRCIIATCLINPGGTACLGGYGAFLSTYYLGFQNPAPAIDGIVISTIAYATQLLLIPSLANFQSNFFPWIRDGDKTERQQHLHVFLWSTIPLTFSSAFFDQLAYQCHRTEVLPPFFLYHDNAALFLSSVIPGGGLFYKGYRYTGWAYYIAEMALASYSTYYWNAGKRGTYAFVAVLALKMTELVHAYCISPAYRFFTNEFSSLEMHPIFASIPIHEDKFESMVGISLIKKYDF
jgi:hypothetical protein